MSRWDAFTEKEKATITVGLAGGLLMEATLHEGDVSPEFALEVAALVSEINEDMGNPGVDPELMEKMRRLTGEQGG